MKRTIKTLSVLVMVGLVLTGSIRAAILSTNVANATPVLLSTNRAGIYGIELTSDKAVTVKFYDTGTTNEPYFGTNYVTAAYQSRIQYKTNFASSYIGQNGFTNWYTNVGLFTLNVTNAAATNQLNPGFVAVVGANQAVVYPVDLLFEQGVVVQATTNVSISVLYRDAK